MARLPTREDLGPVSGLPPNRGRAVAHIRTRAADTSAIGRGVQNLGRGVASLASGITQSALEIERAQRRLGAERERQENFETERRFQEFVLARETSLEDRKRNLPAGNPSGFTDVADNETVDSATQFFETVPDRLKNKYELKLFGVRRRVVNSARGFETRERDRFESAEIDKAKETNFTKGVRTAPLEEVDAVTSEFESFVDGTNLPPRVKEAMKVRGLRDFAKTKINTMTPAEIEGVFASPASSIIDRIIGVESGGRADARNPNSSATGLGQFIKSTWLDLIERHRPDIATDRTEQEILALRTDPILSRQMVGVLMSENAEFMRAKGVSPTSGNLYLSHFLGAGAAMAVIQAGPETSVSEILSQRAINANSSILKGRTAADVLRWAEGKMEGAVPEAFTHLTDDDRQAALKGIEDFLKNRARAEELFSGRDTADPNDKDDRNAVDFAVERSGLNDRLTSMDPTSAAQLTTVVETTGVLPDSSMSRLRSMSVNGSPEERQFALQTTANLLRQKPGVLSSRRGGAELRNDARKFSSFVLAGGLTPEDALKRVDETKTEEFRNKKAALGAEATSLANKIKSEEIANLFDGFFTAEPELGATPVRGRIMFDAFKENFKFHFIETGDEATARNLALDDLRDSYDVSSVTGTNRLMKHPPEKYYPTVDGTHDYVMRQLKEDVTSRAGREVPEDSIFIEAVPQTDADIRAGRLPRYGVSWLKEDGTLDTVPGMVWKPDFINEKKRATERRGRRFRKLREETKNIQLMNFMGDELALPETVGASPNLIEERQRQESASLEEAQLTGALS